VRTADRCALNPFDRPALEVAFQLKQKNGGSITVFSMGPPTAEAALREAMALGADRAALLICDPVIGRIRHPGHIDRPECREPDTWRPLTCCCSAHAHPTAIPARSGPRPPCCMDLTMVTGAVRIDGSPQRLMVEREMDGFREAYEVDTPRPSPSIRRLPFRGIRRWAALLSRSIKCLWKRSPPGRWVWIHPWWVMPAHPRAYFP
jgi:electron transfer flavoprotein beta subunit